MNSSVCFLLIICVISSFVLVEVNSASTYEASQQRTFEVDYKGRRFLKDGKEFKYVAGEMHYFRMPRAYWQDRLRKAKYCGLTAISTYVQWSAHEPLPNEYDFTGQNDLVHYIKLAQKEGLLVLLRPGPFIGAEITWGGMPPWLMTVNPYIRVRTSDASFLYYLNRWFNILLEKMEPLFYGNGGPIIMVQVENEYGSYFACDRCYMKWLAQKIFSFVGGKNAVLYTVDGDQESYFVCGPTPGVLATVDFGPTNGSLIANFTPMIEYNNGGPYVNSEFYPGWLTHWTQYFSRVEADVVVETMKKLLRLDASFSFYVIFGGTNFAFIAGANSPPYRPTTTSYDYDAPISEAGDLTPKYFAIRNTLKKFADSYDLDFNTMQKKPPSNSTKANYGQVKFKAVASIFNATDIWDGEPVYAETPLNFEALKTYSGFVLYETKIPCNLPDPPLLNLTAIRDRAYIFVDEEPRGILDRLQQTTTLPLWIYNGTKLSILVENMGYINYGSQIQGDFKGLIYTPSLGGVTLLGWNMTRVSLSNISGIYEMPTLKSTLQPPAFYEASFKLPGEDGTQPADTFLDPTGWGKGVVFVNGLNMGRFWPIVGPQVTLYIPGCYLKAPPALNSLVIFELEQISADLKMSLIDAPKLRSPPQTYSAFYGSHPNPPFVVT